MKKFIIKLALFTAILVVFAYIFQYIIDIGLKKSDYSFEYKEWYDITTGRASSDILIMGSSRAYVQFSPKAFEDAFKLDTYNLGMDGQTYPLQKWRYDVYARYNKKPRYIIQNVDAFTFSDPIIRFNFSQFIPYLSQLDFQKRFGRHAFFKKKDYYIPLYKYSHSPGIKTAAMLSLFNKDVKDNGKYKGFIAREWYWDDQVFKNVLKSYPNGIVKGKLEKNTFQQFLLFINYCKQNNIKLIMVYAPIYSVFQNSIVNRDSIINVFEQTAKKQNIKFLNYSQDPICRDTAMFYNFNHLNKRGADRFNKQLINDLKKDILMPAKDVNGN